MRRALAAAAALSVCLSGCSGDDRSPTSTTSEPPPTGVTSDSTGPTDSTPTDDPGGPPVLPDAAKAKTTAGAKAFVNYYAEAINYSWHMGTSTHLRETASRKCTKCLDIANFIDQVSDAGGFQHGARWTVLGVGVVPGQPKTHPTLLPLIRVAPGQWKRRENGKLMKIKSHKFNLHMQLSWVDDAWTVSVVDS